jgi:hypothetical protein
MRDLWFAVSTAVEGIGFGRLVAGIAASNPAEGMDVCICVYMLCCPL